MSTEEEDSFMTRLRAASTLESKVEKQDVFARDASDIISSLARSVRQGNLAVDTLVVDAVASVHGRWITSSNTLNDADSTRDKQVSFLGLAAGLVADHLISLAGEHLPWESRVEAASQLPIPSIRRQRDNCGVALRADGDETSAEWCCASLDCVLPCAVPHAESAAAPAHAQTFSVCVPRCLYRCWTAALIFTVYLAEATVCDASQAERTALMDSICADCLTCMLREIQRHAPFACTAAQEETDWDEATRMANLRLAFYYLHTELWLAVQCNVLRSTALRGAALSEFAATLRDALEIGVDVGVEVCMRGLVAPDSDASYSSLIALVSELREPLSIPSTLFLQPGEDQPVSTGVVLWDRLASAWLTQVLAPIAQQLLTDSTPLAQRWRQQESRARSSGVEASRGHIVSLRERLAVWLKGLEDVLGASVVTDVAAYRTLHDLAISFPQDTNTLQ